MNLILKTIPLACCGLLACLSAGETAGTVVTPGRLSVNNLPILHNATLPAGALLITSTSAARVDLAAGATVALDANSVAVAYPSYIQLRQGRAMLTSPKTRIEALGLSVNSPAAGNHTLVNVSGGSVEVASLHGVAQVRNLQGILIALVHKDKPLSFQPNTGPAETSLTGTLRRQGAKFILHDELTATDVEIRGPSLSGLLGRRVQAAGLSQLSSRTPSHLVMASRVTPVEPEPDPASDPAPTVAKSGLSAGTKIGLAAIAFSGMAAAIVVPVAMSN